MSHPEQQYLDLLSDILANGEKRMDRTGVGTLSVFGRMMRFDVSNWQAPILTTKRIFWKTAVKEMLWFLTGETNIQPLLKENVRIWTDWPLARYRKTTESNIDQGDFEKMIVEDDEFAKKWGDLGPVYGKQWRKWKGPDGRTFDQVAEVVNLLRNNPTSRRILFHGWNVAEIADMALPPCHMNYQFFVNTEKHQISVSIGQRSGDMFLGVGWNLLHGYVLLLMLGQQSGYTPGEVIWMGGDCHIYLNHVDQVREQLTRAPRPWPTMKLARQAASIDDYKIDDFIVENYDPHPAIAGLVAV